MHSIKKLNQKWMSDILHILEGFLILYQHRKHLKRIQPK